MKSILKGLLPMLLSTAVNVAKQAIEQASKKNDNGYLLHLNTVIDAVYSAYKQKRPFYQVFKDSDIFNALLLFMLGLMEDAASSPLFRRMAGEQQGKFVAIISALKVFLSIEDKK
jgi:hypothetical protein